MTVVLLILKIIGYVLLAVLAIIILVLVIPVNAKVSYIDGVLKYNVKFSFYSIISSVKKTKKVKRKPKKKQRQKKTKEKITEMSVNDNTAEENPRKPSESPKAPEILNEEKSEIKQDDEDVKDVKKSSGKITKEKKKGKKKEKADKEKTSISEKISMFLEIFEAAGKYVKRIFKGFRFSNLYIDIKISDEDAYDCAIKYGRMCILVYNGLALLDRIFTVKAKKIGVRCVFGEESSVYNASAKVSFRLGTAVLAAIGFLITYFIVNKLKKQKNQAPKQQTANA